MSRAGCRAARSSSAPGAGNVQPPALQPPPQRARPRVWVQVPGSAGAYSGRSVTRTRVKVHGHWAGARDYRAGGRPGKAASAPCLRLEGPHCWTPLPLLQHMMPGLLLVASCRACGEAPCRVCYSRCPILQSNSWPCSKCGRRLRAWGLPPTQASARWCLWAVARWRARRPRSPRTLLTCCGPRWRRRASPR